MVLWAQGDGAGGVLGFVRFAPVGLDPFGINGNVPGRECPMFPGMPQGSTWQDKEVLMTIF